MRARAAGPHTTIARQAGAPPPSCPPLGLAVILHGLDVRPGALELCWVHPQQQIAELWAEPGDVRVGILRHLRLGAAASRLTPHASPAHELARLTM